MLMEWRLGSLLRLLCWVAGVAVALFFLAFTLGSTNPSDQAGAGRVGAASDARPTGGSAVAFQIARTNGAGLNIRECAAVTCAKVGWAAEGATFTATCSVPGARAAGDTAWLKGSSGGQAGFVARSYLDATGGARAADAVPACPGSGSGHGAAKG